MNRAAWGWLAALIAFAVMTALIAGYAAARSAAERLLPISIQARGRGAPWMNWDDGYDLTAGGSSSRATGGTRREPRALAAGDLDGDGLPDLVVGYATARGGGLDVHRGNIDAGVVPPSSGEQARAAVTAGTAALLPEATAWSLAVAPDFVACLDVDGDGALDILAAQRHDTRLHVLRGDGRGNLEVAPALALPGPLTALAVSDGDDGVGWPGLAVGVQTERGPAVLIFRSSAAGGADSPAALPVSGAVVDLAFGRLDGRPGLDLAVLSERALAIHFGPLLATTAPALVAAAEFVVPGTAVAAGNFVGDRRQELAVLTDDGVVHVLGNQARPSGRSPAPQSGVRFAAWAEHAAWRLDLPAGAGDGARLVPARLTSLDTEALVIIDPRLQSFRVLHQGRTREVAGEAQPEAVELALDAPPLAVLPMQLNADALADLVVLRRDRDAPAVLRTTAAAHFTVDDGSDAGDDDWNDGQCATRQGRCTLRAAIQQANRDPGADLITFAVAAVRLDDALPEVDEALTIDGTSMGQVEIDGRAVTTGNILRISGGTSVIRRLAMYASGNGGAVHLIDGGGNRVEANYFGLDASGLVARGTGTVSIQDSNDNVVGGSLPPTRNVIAGAFPTFCVAISGASAGNEIQHNLIGTDGSGQRPLGCVAGVLILSVSINDQLGEPTDNVVAGNVIAGVRRAPQLPLLAPLTGRGVLIGGGARNRIERNFIGTDASGRSGLGNEDAGVLVSGDADFPAEDNRVEENAIAFNGGSGVQVNGARSLGTEIQGNSIHDNGGLGIDLSTSPDSLAADGVTANDPRDADAGPNQLQNFPVLTLLPPDRVRATLASAPDTSFSIEFYRNTRCDPSGHGEGEESLTSRQVRTDGDGHAELEVQLPISARDVITAIALDPGENTSEFSACAATMSTPTPGTPTPMPATPTPPATPPATGTATASATETATATLTASPRPPSVVDFDVVQAIEFRQHVESWNNGQPAAVRELPPGEQLRHLVANKPTWMRLYIESGAQGPSSIRVTLTATRNGQRLSALAPVTRTAQPGAVVDHFTAGQSYNVYDFALPFDWLAGDIEVAVELDPRQQPGMYDTVRLPFHQRQLRVGYLLFNDLDPDQQAIARKAAGLIGTLYPAVVTLAPYGTGRAGSADPRCDTGTNKGQTCATDANCPGGRCIANKGKCLQTLATLWELSSGDPGRHVLFGWMPGSGIDGGALRSPGKTSMGVGYSKVEQLVAAHTVGRDFAAHGIAHEIAHLYWLEHPHDNSKLPWGCTGCPSRAMLPPAFQHIPPPYIESLVTDAFFRRNRGQAGVGRSDFELMWQSEGGPAPWAYEARTNRNVWISQSSWEWLFDKLASPGTPPVPPRAALDAAPAVMLRGLVHADGRAVLDAALPAVSPADAPSEEGAFCLVLEDAAGQGLARQCFGPPEPGEDGQPIDPLPIVQTVARPSTLARVRLLRRGELLAEQVVSAHRPSVAIVSPQTGEPWEGSTIRWSAHDDDGDMLRYLVEYSSDDRQSWVAVALDVAESALDLDTALLAGGEASWLRVVASDGLEFASDEIGPLRVPRKSPQVFIVNPEADDVVEARAPVALQATAFDPEDGGLSGSAIVWSSDRDGFLGHGDLLAPRLSAGVHLVTVSARDGDGNVANAAVEVRVRPRCTGDCSGDARVTVDELVRGVNIALGSTGVGECLPFDPSDDRRVAVDELVQGVGAALNGCPPVPSLPPVTPVVSPSSVASRTATQTPTPSVGPPSSPTPTRPPRTPTRTPSSTMAPSATPIRTPAPTASPTPTGERAYCAPLSGPLLIPDGDPLGVASDLAPGDAARIATLRVELDVSHPWPGDLVATLTHVGDGRSAVLLDRPLLLPGTDGCGYADVSCVVDDAAARACDGLCRSTPPALYGRCRGIQALSAFDGARLDGTWRLVVADEVRQDVGTLDRWCLLVEPADAP